jgi:glycosyltransferase involved in cell wall biosynthesis
MERHAFLHTNATVSINREIAHRVRKRSDGLIASDRHLILPHGFDPEDFRHDVQSESDDRMRIVYTGVFYDAQSPEVFLRGLARFLAVSPNRRNQITAQFLGLLPRSAHRLIKELGLSAQVDFRGYVPHSEAVRAMREAHVLWMTIGRRTGSSGISTGKLYEYFGARKPILGLVPHGVARDSLVQYGAAELTEPDDPDAVAVSLGKLFAQWESGMLPVPDESFVLEHDRRELALKLSRILNNEPMSGTA